MTIIIIIKNTKWAKKKRSFLSTVCFYYLIMHTFHMLFLCTLCSAKWILTLSPSYRFCPCALDCRTFSSLPQLRLASSMKCFTMFLLLTSSFVLPCSVSALYCDIYPYMCLNSQTRLCLAGIFFIFLYLSWTS